MMRLFHDLPLKRKLLFGLLATCATALLLACSALFWFQFVTFRQGFAAELEAIGAIVARNSATPLLFGDRKSAAEVLDVLRLKPHIVFARVSDENNALFVAYGAVSAAVMPMPDAGKSPTVQFSDGLAHLTLPIEHEGGGAPGRLAITARFEPEFARLRSLFVALAGLVLCGSLVVVAIMSTALQRIMIRPVTALAEVTARIEREGDYGVRAPEAGHDEVGQLTRAFNRMLGQIQQRDTRVQETQQRFEIAVMGSSDGLWDYDCRTGTAYYSPRWKAIIGYADNELPNRPEIFDEHLHPDDRAAVWEKVGAYLRGEGVAYTAEFRLRNKDGSYRWILSRGAALRDAAGQPQRFAGSHTDITARKLAEEKERQRVQRAEQRQAVLLKFTRLESDEWEQQLETILMNVAQLLDTARTSYWSMNPRQQILAREKLFQLDGGFSAQPVRLRHFELPPHIETFAASGQPVVYAEALRDPRLESATPVSAVHAPACRDQRLLGMLVCEHIGAEREWSLSDLEFLRAVAQQLVLAIEGQERRRAEAQLRQSEVRYRTVVESVKEVIFQSDAKGRWVFLNSAWRIVTGHFVEDSLGRSCLEFVHLEDRPRAARSLVPLLSGRVKESKGEFRFTTRSGEVRWVEVTAQVLPPGMGGQASASGTLTDITERKAAEAEMVRLNRELVVASRHAGMAEIATGVLHNVGNVLNSVNVSTNLVADQLRRSKAASLAKAAQLLSEHRGDIATYLAHDPKGRQVPPFIEAIAVEITQEQAAMTKEMQALQTNVDHIKQIVGMQQSYAKISGATEHVDPVQLFEDALRMVSSSLTRHQVTVNREFARTPTVHVDRHKVLQILVNLLSNARQAAKISAGEHRITLRIAGADDRVRLAVADNGVGIPAENLARIFSHGFTTKKTGHGFGLHSCANAAKELGGSLSVHSAGPGLGATFTLELPLARHSAHPIAA